MALHINIEDLLSGKAVESNRLDYKEGWNPDAIYRTICAFANDFEDTGGGYIVVGVKEENGHAMRPVIGIDSQKIELIEKEMVGLNNLIQPYYQPRLFIEEADGKTILIIKVTAGERRPYKVPDCVTAKQKTYNYYIRYNSSCIVPKNEYEEELRSLANRVPFDDQGNANIKIEDISTSILRDHLVAVKSALASEDMSGKRRLGEFLKELKLTEGRSTGIPTIQEELANNGSPSATIETDDARTYFIIDIPCHPDFREEKLVLNNENVVKDVVKDVVKQLSERQQYIIDLIRQDEAISAAEMSQRLNVTSRTVQRDISELKNMGVLVREGGKLNGKWIIKIE